MYCTCLTEPKRDGLHVLSLSRSRDVDQCLGTKPQAWRGDRGITNLVAALSLPALEMRHLCMAGRAVPASSEVPEWRGFPGAERGKCVVRVAQSDPVGRDD